jgi:hypothetical protein
MSAEESAVSKPTVLQDFHLAFIRLCKRYRFTEHAARELMPYMYTGPAARLHRPPRDQMSCGRSCLFKQKK